MIEIIEHREKWNKLIEACSCADFYHTYDYHELDIKEGEKAVLLHFREGELSVLLPLILRKISGTPYSDATSVYGYPGPLTINCKEGSNLNSFQEALNTYFNDQKLVSVFSRLNPFIPYQELLLQGFGEIISPGAVVNIDLTRTEEKQVKAYHRRLRTYINSLRKAYTINKTPRPKRIDHFIDIYYENMRRVGAMDRYFFERDYFYRLMESPSFDSTLLSAEDPETGEMVAGALFIQKNEIVQYHLSGVQEGHLKLNPVKLLIDEMRIKAHAEGYRYFNLGGGVANRKDSLLEFKKGYSDDIRPFKVWRHIVDKEVYAKLVQEKHGGSCIHLPGSCQNFFPCYRCETSKLGR
ncbi:peptidoglycan bridge formation glycyltransferase FemA/FemB family protein [Robiginitalea sp. SC105]|uniref:peptidoglycan bridge formation glycyltransferase FemA/FemB family protein n=1 Tax=Robiginitalea sp. SC105 TaxID=2762332 RepID=UPI00163AA1F2|nr:peptidoglycan bridge formation glycyltransferase FemA/FemB family protein [Robiginitalea sp. SC105]MBC2840322.1 peptidoglycan bridge formation glycyltransferase FemA/FemB family protein [Robiginitalea sp. SC105]